MRAESAKPKARAESSFCRCAVAAGAHQNGRKRRPTAGCCMRPHRPFSTVHHLRAPDRRCRWPLVTPRGRPTFGTSRKCSARMGRRGTRAIDRRYTQVSIRGGREQGRQGRERSTRWYRGGGEAWCTPKKSPLSMNWAACKRSEGARSNASRMPKKPMTGSRYLSTIGGGEQGGPLRDWEGDRVCILESRLIVCSTAMLRIDFQQGSSGTSLASASVRCAAWNSNSVDSRWIPLRAGRSIATHLTT